MLEIKVEETRVYQEAQEKECRSITLNECSANILI
jgi:hypothetical protein